MIIPAEGEKELQNVQVSVLGEGYLKNKGRTEVVNVHVERRVLEAATNTKVFVVCEPKLNTSAC